MTGEPIPDGKYNRWPPGDGAGRGGRFAPKNGAPAAPRRRRGSAKPADRPAGGPPADLTAATVDELTDAFRAVSAQPPGTPGLEQQLLAIDAELARREGVAQLTVEDTPHSRQIDDLTEAGWSFLDAYAEVHHLDVRKLEREQRMSMLAAEHRPGEPRAKTIRRMYHEYTLLAALQAEDETAGNMLSRAGVAKGIDASSLWSGTSARARKYASDELKQWWSEHGGRITATQWAAQFTGDTAGAKRSKMTGQDKDFGI
jgi:hypothetical protein